MSKESIKNSCVMIITAGLWLALDLFTKKMALTWANSPAFIPKFWLKGWLGLSFQRNTGIAFGLPFSYTLLIAGSVVLIFVLTWLGIDLLKKSTRLNLLKSVLLGIIMGGALGNLWGRLTERSVIDFLVLRPIPTFNVADIGITLGLLTLALLTLQESKNN
jgi:signal peptidase II